VVIQSLNSWMKVLPGLLAALFLESPLVSSALQVAGHEQHTAPTRLSNFIEWLAAKGAGIPGVSIVDSHFGVGLRSRSFSSAGAALASIPCEAALDYTSAAVHPVIGPRVRDAYDDVQRTSGTATTNDPDARMLLAADYEHRILGLSMLLHFEYFITPRLESSWGPYLDLLPGPGADCDGGSTLPRCWTPEEVHMADEAALLAAGRHASLSNFRAGSWLRAVVLSIVVP
jgi:hypothetical protein